MTSITNRWKLGVFVVSSVLLGMATLVFLGAHHLKDDYEIFHLYFDEDVSGLERGSAVKFRGVPIGSVHKVTIAEDNKAVDVEIKISLSDLIRIGLAQDVDGLDHTLERARAQLVFSGITGSKFVLIDYFDENHETLAFPFRTPPNTLLTVKSTVKSMESVMHALERLPDLFDEFSRATHSINDQLEQIDLVGLIDGATTALDDWNDQQLPGQLSDLRERADGLLAHTDEAVEAFTEVDRPALHALVDRLERALDDARIAESSKAVVDAGRAIQELADEDGELLGTARDAGLLLEELRGSVRTLERTLDAIGALAELLERNPRAVLSGRDFTASPTRSP